MDQIINQSVIYLFIGLGTRVVAVLKMIFTKNKKQLN